jgi:predicted nuclease of predicted toxin-antitoxin system
MPRISHQTHRLEFILDHNMIQGGSHRQCVGCLLVGRGHRVHEIRGTDLQIAGDPELARYAADWNLVIVTFDSDFRHASQPHGCRCLLIKPFELTARERFAQHYREVISLFATGSRFVVLPARGRPYPESSAHGQASSTPSFRRGISG